MTKAICIAGLPGSGKTHLARQLAMHGVLVDDITSLDQLPQNGSVDLVVITDPYFCLDDARNKADILFRGMYDTVEWFFFENAPEKCLHNIQYRNDGRKVKDLVKILTKTYHPPEFAIEIWQPDFCVDKL
jgi:DNA modification methylase